MRIIRLGAWCLSLGWIGAVALLGCAHLPKYGLVADPVPSGALATPSPGSSATPSACATQAPTATVIVVMSSSITATSIAPYGSLNGYTRLNPDGSFGNVATVISVTTRDIIQFVNGENSGPSTVLHSAAGFSTASFPAIPYGFPTAVQQQAGNAISASGTWSTGRVGPICYSQSLTASPGTYYFGDLDYYNLAAMRDVIVVSP